MPLYDFRCLDCGDTFEALVLKIAPACPSGSTIDGNAEPSTERKVREVEREGKVREGREEEKEKERRRERRKEETKGRLKATTVGASTTIDFLVTHLPFSPSS